MTMVKGFQEISYDELMDVSGGFFPLVGVAIVIAISFVGCVQECSPRAKHFSTHWPSSN